MFFLKVSVVIVNWNGRHLLPACLAALKSCRPGPDQVIVVDNGSEDGSVAYLEACDWPPLQTLFLPSNTGFSGGNNAALPLVTGDIVALLNNDAEVAPAWIGSVLPLFEDPQLGMVASKVLKHGNPAEIDKAGHLMFPDGLNRGRGTGRPADDFSLVEEVLWPDGCAGFYRKTMIEEIGFLDGDFFLYGEDAELGMRARWAGYRCLFQPHSLVYHRQSASLGKFAPQKVYYVERNRLWLLIKTFPLSALLCSPWFSLQRYAMNLVAMLMKRGAASGFQKNHNGGLLLRTLLKALWHGIRGIPLMWRKRGRVLRRIDARAMKALLRRHRISAREITLQD